MTKQVLEIPTNAQYTVAELIEALENSGAQPETPVRFAVPKAAGSSTGGHGTCWCGCGTHTKKKFAPGHDSKFHSLAKKVARGEAAMPTSFVCSEARADFMLWHDREVAAISQKRLMAAPQIPVNQILEIDEIPEIEYIENVDELTDAEAIARLDGIE